MTIAQYATSFLEVQIRKPQGVGERKAETRSLLGSGSGFRSAAGCLTWILKEGRKITHPFPAPSGKFRHRGPSKVLPLGASHSFLKIAEAAILSWLHQPQGPRGRFRLSSQSCLGLRRDSIAPRLLLCRIPSDQRCAAPVTAIFHAFPRK